MRTPRPRRGFALLAALALATLTSILALELSVAARADRRSAANVVEHAAATAAAQAGLEEARTRLLHSLIAAGQTGERLQDPWAMVVAVPADPVVLNELRCDFVMRDAGALLHLNRATEEQLRRLLIALRVDAARADRVAQAISDWRDGDDLHRSRGAERAEYLRAGSPVLPENMPFASVATLRHVAGVGDALYERIHPYFTVVGSGRVNLNAAGPAVLLTLPGMSEESVALVMRDRRRGRRITSLSTFAQELSIGARRRLLEALPVLAVTTVLDTREVHVTSIASVDGMERARAEAVMVKDNGVAIAWRRITP